MQQLSSDELLNITGGYSYSTMPNFAVYSKIWKWICRRVKSLF